MKRSAEWIRATSRYRAAAPLPLERPQVSAVNGSIYNVTVSGIVGNGTVGLNLLNDGTIQDLAGFSLASTPLNSNLTFQPPATYTTAAQPSLLVLADLNGDGILDLATSSYSSSRGSVLLGTAMAPSNRRRRSRPRARARPRSASGDFNGDGKKDLVVTLEALQVESISWRVTATATSNSSARPSRVLIPRNSEVGDFNKDGKLDVATVRSHREFLWACSWAMAMARSRRARRMLSGTLSRDDRVVGSEWGREPGPGGGQFGHQSCELVFRIWQWHVPARNKPW